MSFSIEVPSEFSKAGFGLLDQTPPEVAKRFTVEELKRRISRVIETEHAMFITITHNNAFEKHNDRRQIWILQEFLSRWNVAIKYVYLVKDYSEEGRAHWHGIIQFAARSMLKQFKNEIQDLIGYTAVSVLNSKDRAIEYLFKIYEPNRYTKAGYDKPEPWDEKKYITMDNIEKYK